MASDNIRNLFEVSEERSRELNILLEQAVETSQSTETLFSNISKIPIKTAKEGLFLMTLFGIEHSKQVLFQNPILVLKMLAASSKIKMIPVNGLPDELRDIKEKMSNKNEILH